MRMSEILTLTKLDRLCGKFISYLMSECREKIHFSSSTCKYDYWRNLIRVAYVYIKRQIEAHIDDIDSEMLEQFLPWEEVITAVVARDNAKVDYILKSILQQDEYNCEKFIYSLLCKGYLEKQRLEASEHKELPNSVVVQCSGLTVEDFTCCHVQRYLISELEPYQFLDILLEWHLISMEEHGRISTARNRVAKIKQLLEIMTRQIEINWFYKFCFILSDNGRPLVIEQIKELVRQQSLETPFDYPPELGSTLKIETFQETEENLRQHNINDMNDQLDHTLENPNIVDRRDGCIEFILLNRWYSLSKEQQRETCLEFVNTLIQLPNVRETVKPQQEFKIALGGYNKCISLLDENGEALKCMPTRLALRIYRAELMEILKGPHFNDTIEKLLCPTDVERVVKLKDQDLQAEYVLHLLLQPDESQLQKTLENSNTNDYCRLFAKNLMIFTCLDCYRCSIFNSYQSILDELDTDIMQRTLDEKSQIPSFITKICIKDANSISRSERARVFLQFVVVKGQLLISFAEKLATRTNIVLKHKKCSGCSGKSGAEQDEWLKTTQFVFVVDETGNLKEKISEESRMKLKCISADKTEEKCDSSVCRCFKVEGYG